MLAGHYFPYDMPSANENCNHIYHNENCSHIYRERKTLPRKLCTFGKACRRKKCKFAHSISELVPPRCIHGNHCDKFLDGKGKCFYQHPTENKIDYLKRIMVKKQMPPGISFDNYYPFMEHQVPQNYAAITLEATSARYKMYCKLKSCNHLKIKEKKCRNNPSQEEIIHNTHHSSDKKVSTLKVKPPSEKEMATIMECLLTLLQEESSLSMCIGKSIRNTLKQTIW